MMVCENERNFLFFLGQAAPGTSIGDISGAKFDVPDGAVEVEIRVEKEGGEPLPFDVDFVLRNGEGVKGSVIEATGLDKVRGEPGNGTSRQPVHRNAKAMYVHVRPQPGLGVASQGTGKACAKFLPRH